MRKPGLAVSVGCAGVEQGPSGDFDPGSDSLYWLCGCQGDSVVVTLGSFTDTFIHSL